MLDVTRELYNALLQERRDSFRLRGVSVSRKEQYSEITALRSPADRIDRRLAAVYRECEDHVLRRLDLAFRGFFVRCKQGKVPGFPRFKPAARWRQLQFAHGMAALRFDKRQGRLTVPGVGQIKLRKGRQVPDFGRAWIVRKNSRWYACFECTREVRPLPPKDELVGLDRGVHVLAALSNGVLISNRAVGEKRRAIIARLQRELETTTQRNNLRRVANPNNHARAKAIQRLALAREREANARRDYLHKAAHRIVSAAGTVALEKLNLKAMTRSSRGDAAHPGRNVAAKSALNRRLMDAGFGLLRKMIAAKAEETARAVVEVDGRFSSLECSRCGHRARESRRRRRFACVACGFRLHADVNAALVIRRRAQSALKSGPDPAEDAGRVSFCYPVGTHDEMFGSSEESVWALETLPHIRI